MRPILVTGVPRSGTTWLARLLALSPGTALAGREPMNPRGRQYALGGSLDGWTRLTDPSPLPALPAALGVPGVEPDGLQQVRHPAVGRTAPADPRGGEGPLRPAVAAAPSPPRPVRPRCWSIATPAPSWPATAGWRGAPGSTSSQRSPRAPRCAALGLDLPEITEASEPVTAQEMGIFWSVLHELALADAATPARSSSRTPSSRAAARWPAGRSPTGSA